MSDDKRKTIRIKTPLVIQYCFNCEDVNKKWDITTVKNISETGMCILTGRQYDKASSILLRLKIPSRPFEPIEITGNIVDSIHAGHGESYITRIEFMDLKDEVKSLFHEYVEWVINSEKKEKPT